MICCFPEIQTHLKLYFQIHLCCWFLRHWLENDVKNFIAQVAEEFVAFVGNSEEGDACSKEEKDEVMSWARMGTVEVLPEQS